MWHSLNNANKFVIILLDLDASIDQSRCQEDVRELFNDFVKMDKKNTHQDTKKSEVDSANASGTQALTKKKQIIISKTTHLRSSLHAHLVEI